MSLISFRSRVDFSSVNNWKLYFFWNGCSIKDVVLVCLKEKIPQTLRRTLECTFTEHTPAFCRNWLSCSPCRLSVWCCGFMKTIDSNCFYNDNEICRVGLQTTIWDKHNNLFRWIDQWLLYLRRKCSSNWPAEWHMWKESCRVTAYLFSLSSDINSSAIFITHLATSTFLKLSETIRLKMWAQRGVNEIEDFSMSLVWKNAAHSMHCHRRHREVLIHAISAKKKALLSLW